MKRKNERYLEDKYDVIVKSKDQYSKEELFLLSRT